MDTDKIKNALAIALLLVAVIILVNTFVGHTALWQTVNYAYIAIPLIFTLTCVRLSARDMFVAALLWIPAVVTIYMIAEGLSGIEGPIWTMMNMYQLLVYGYFGGTRLALR